MYKLDDTRWVITLLNEVQLSMMMYTCLPLFTVSRTIPANNNNFKKNVDNNFNMDNRLLFEEEFEGNSKDSIYFQVKLKNKSSDQLLLLMWNNRAMNIGHLAQIEQFW